MSSTGVAKTMAMMEMPRLGQLLKWQAEQAEQPEQGEPAKASSGTKHRGASSNKEQKRRMGSAYDAMA